MAPVAHFHRCGGLKQCRCARRVEGRRVERCAGLLPPGGFGENVLSAFSGFWRGLYSWLMAPTSQLAVQPL